jgi:hypothetical protein
VAAYIKTWLQQLMIGTVSFPGHFINGFYGPAQLLSITHAFPFPYLPAKKLLLSENLLNSALSYPEHNGYPL